MDCAQGTKGKNAGINRIGKVHNNALIKSKSKRKTNNNAVGGKPPPVAADLADEGTLSPVKEVIHPYKYRDARALARGYMYDMTQYCRDSVDKF